MLFGIRRIIFLILVLPQLSFAFWELDIDVLSLDSFTSYEDGNRYGDEETAASFLLRMGSKKLGLAISAGPMYTGFMGAVFGRYHYFNMASSPTEMHTLDTGYYAPALFKKLRFGVGVTVPLGLSDADHLMRHGELYPFVTIRWDDGFFYYEFKHGWRSGSTNLIKYDAIIGCRFPLSKP